MLTGRYGFRTGLRWVTEYGDELPDREYTLPEMLARHPEHKYRTAAFGKLHLHTGDVENPRGGVRGVIPERQDYVLG